MQPTSYVRRTPTPDVTVRIETNESPFICAGLLAYGIFLGIVAMAVLG